MSQTQINDVGVAADVAFGGAFAPDRRQDQAEPASQPLILGLSQSAWIQIGVIALLFGALFWPNLRRLWDKTNPFYGDANWGHAICIPFIGLYYLYVNRDKLLSPAQPGELSRSQTTLRVWILISLVALFPLALIREELTPIFFPAAAVSAFIIATTFGLTFIPRSDSLMHRAREHSAGWFGGFIMLFGIAIFQYAIFPGQNDFLKDFGMVVTLFGVVLALTGWVVMKIAWFPIIFLVCGIPWPGLVYSKVAGPLQQLAANVAVWTLQLTGVEANVGGTKISMIGGDGNWRTLNVAEACAGMRSLMTFVSVAAAVAFLSHRPLWQKIIVVLFAVPIAIFCNVMRVSGQGLLDRYVSHSLSENFAHQFVGLIMLIPAFLLILLVGWVLDQIFVEQIDRRFVAHAPKVITRNSAPIPAAIPATAPRTLAEIRGNDAPPPPAAPRPAPGSPPPPPAADPAKAPPARRSLAEIRGNGAPPPAPRPAAQTPPPISILRTKPQTAPKTPGAPRDPKSVVPPPPSVRLAPRAPTPRKRPADGNQNPGPGDQP
jgi:exosortase